MIRQIFRLTILSILVCSSRITFAGTPTQPIIKNTIIKPAEARMLARDAYIFTYPLIMSYRAMYKQAIDVHSPFYTGGFGKLKSLGIPTPSAHQVSAPNVDTAYTWAWVDLRSEPWVMTLPAIDAGRYYTSQWNDLWGFILDSPGSIKDNNFGDNYLIAPANWEGQAPKNIKRIIRSDTLFVGSLTRTEFIGGRDLNNVSMIQGNYHLEPLSAFQKTTVPALAPLIKWPEWEESFLNTGSAFAYANFLLQFTIPSASDATIINHIAKIGVIAGKAWDPKGLPDDVEEAINLGIQDAIHLIDEAAQTTSNTKLFGDRQYLKNNYLLRAAGVAAGMFGNSAEQVMYIPIERDADGHPLDGSKYTNTITFPANSLPPVTFFWSLTLYDLPKRGLVENRLDRYNIGSRTQDLTLNKDGSLTIYIQRAAPSNDKTNNWLPASNGPFYLVFRAYGADESLILGEWKIPAIESVALPPPLPALPSPVAIPPEEQASHSVAAQEPEKVDGEDEHESAHPKKTNPIGQITTHTEQGENYNYSAELANPPDPKKNAALLKAKAELDAQAEKDKAAKASGETHH